MYTYITLHVFYGSTNTYTFHYLQAGSSPALPGGKYGSRVGRVSSTGWRWIEISWHDRKLEAKIQTLSVQGTDRATSVVNLTWWPQITFKPFQNSFCSAIFILERSGESLMSSKSDSDATAQHEQLMMTNDKMLPELHFSQCDRLWVSFKCKQDREVICSFRSCMACLAEADDLSEWTSNDGRNWVSICFYCVTHLKFFLFSYIFIHFRNVIRNSA